MPPRQAVPGLIESEVERSCVRVTNRRQSDSEDRSKSNRLDTKQGRHLIRQALQLFELLACNVRGQGAGPLAFSWGCKGDILSRERISPLPVQRLRRCFPSRASRGKPPQPFRAVSPFRAARGNQLTPAGAKKSTLAGALFKSLRISRTGTSGRLRRWRNR